nr:diiron oxygenase [Segniliparus rugosus]
MKRNTWLAELDPIADKAYCERLATLSEGSVRRSFNPFTDIDWDAPEFEVVPNDRRWLLPQTDPIAKTDWYQSLPEEKQIEVGMWRQANVAKVGLQFEVALIRGMVLYSVGLPNGSPEYRYCVHEIAEECNHNQMFQEMVNRIGAEVSGMSKLRQFTTGFGAELLAQFFPSAFFTAVLAGEEPIDFVQKSILREGKSIHPIMESVMAIHVAEEARHISFAHEFLKLRTPRVGRLSRFALSLAYPLIMRFVEELIVVPPRSFWKKFDIPKSVKKEIFWQNEEARDFRRRLLADSRALAHEMGIMNPVAKLLWRLLSIDGRPSRFRSEPQRRHFEQQSAPQERQPALVG